MEIAHITWLACTMNVVSTSCEAKAVIITINKLPWLLTLIFSSIRSQQLEHATQLLVKEKQKQP